MIQMIGMDHTLASVEVRSLFTLGSEEAVRFLKELKMGLGATGLVLLATCNRLEIWASFSDETETVPNDLLDALCRFKNLETKAYADCFEMRTGREAVSHLFLLTAGLKSAILAEDQIVTQVGKALAFSREHYLTDNVCEVLFRMAVTSAKRIKTEVHFSRADRSAIEQAVRGLDLEGYDWKQKTCMVIGNGEYGRLAANTLARTGARVVVTVRQYHSGVVEIPDGCERIHYGERLEFLPKADLVVSATASPHYTLRLEDVKKQKLERSLKLIDLAVPADIDPEIGKLDGVELTNIDDYKSPGAEGNEEAYRACDRILAEEEDKFWFWYEDRQVVKRVGRIQDKAVEDFHLRMRKKVNQLAIDDTTKAKLANDMDQSVKKTLGKLLYELQDRLNTGDFRDCLDAMLEIYGEGDTK